MVDFSQVNAASGDSGKIDQYSALIKANASAPAALKEIVSHALRENGSRQLEASEEVAAGAVSGVYNCLSTLPAEARKEVGTEAVRQLFARRADHPALQVVDSQIRKALAALHKEDEEFFEAADMLADLSTSEMSEGER